MFVTSRFELDNLVVKIFDITNPDPNKRLVNIFENYKTAGKHLYMCPNILRRHADSKTPVFCPILKKNVAVRVRKREPHYKVITSKPLS